VAFPYNYLLWYRKLPYKGIARSRDAPFSFISSSRCNYDCILPQLIPMNAMDFDIDDEDVVALPWVPRPLQLEIWCLRLRQGTDGEGLSTELTEDFNFITWWPTAPYPPLRQWAFDPLSCPAISCEWERVFSSAKNLITAVRNTLADTTIEAAECLKAWFSKGHVKREEDVF
jgi:hypothetical protein